MAAGLEAPTSPVPRSTGAHGCTASDGRAMGARAQTCTARCDCSMVCSAGTSVPHYRLHEGLCGFAQMFWKGFLMAAKMLPSQPGREAQHSTAQHSSSARLAARHAPPQWTSTIYIVNEKSWRAESGTACLQRGRSYVRNAKHRSIPTEQSGSIFQREMRPHGRVESSPLLSCRLPLTDGGRHGGGRRRRGAAVRGPLRTSG